MAFQINDNHIASVTHDNIDVQRQTDRIFGGVKKNRRDFAAENNAGATFIGNMRNILSDMPLH